MNKIINQILGLGVGVVLACGCGNTPSETQTETAASHTFQIDASKTIAKVEPTMYGIFFEDINFAIDGGLYAELVKNRSFEFDKPLRGWTELKDKGLGVRFLPINTNNPRNTRFMRVQIEDQGSGAGLLNEGFRGMGLKEGLPHNFSIQVRGGDGKVSAIRIELLDSKGEVIANSRVDGINNEWQTLTTSLTPSKTDAKGTMKIWFEGEGTVDIDMVSLFPTDTWKGRKNGLRADLVQLLADMDPGFLRFPGGCIVEGFDLSQRYQWKNTVGDVDERVVTINRWNFEFDHRPAPDYYQSFGVGFYEYFLLAEDLEAEPVPILNCGMACQFNTGELVPLDQLDPYIQDALDLIEFANGSTDSKWGELRADMGHPEPFNLKMLGVGNEQWGPQYVERYVPIVNAVKAKYPEIQIIAATGSDGSIFPNGEEEIEYLWKEWKRLKPEIVDEHFYRNPDWFMENTDWYDNYERTGSKLFVGEWAAQSVGVASPDNKNNWETALSEAAFLTGLERNADLVTMTSYAPLFAHAEGWQWTPDLIWFDNLDSYGTANYYVQKMYATNPGTHVIPLEKDGKPVTGQNGLYATATRDENAGELIIKIVNTGEAAVETSFDVAGATIGAEVTAEVLSSKELEAVNTLDEGNKISPRTEKKTLDSEKLAYQLEPYSFTVLRVEAK
ncbi:alpha-L-arabinofuranosidase C-terminal domain-containing protein [Reichenbachiella agariperforans]|uniref:alpha-L-arabinofuranosidase C-terminal domain-containing protein n=1 Tax=Reichenbachiella agariperforans TaxID=156994 RepID=UPI001C088E7B|nr:alpha-L-arabinofuranosidase C-terminal domain-containing protein [Reichenbachiella agariperforans]MBU2912387.1 alpha-L-arabinofuranosidase [Reichenbachiella agariperforans]